MALAAAKGAERQRVEKKTVVEPASPTPVAQHEKGERNSSATGAQHEAQQRNSERNSATLEERNSATAQHSERNSEAEEAQQRNTKPAAEGQKEGGSATLEERKAEAREAMKKKKKRQAVKRGYLSRARDYENQANAIRDEDPARADELAAYSTAAKKRAREIELEITNLEN